MKTFAKQFLVVLLATCSIQAAHAATYKFRQAVPNVRANPGASTPTTPRAPRIYAEVWTQSNGCYLNGTLSYIPTWDARPQAEVCSEFVGQYAIKDSVIPGMSGVYTFMTARPKAGYTNAKQVTNVHASGDSCVTTATDGSFMGPVKLTQMTAQDGQACIDGIVPNNSYRVYLSSQQTFPTNLEEFRLFNSGSPFTYLISSVRPSQACMVNINPNGSMEDLRYVENFMQNGVNVCNEPYVYYEASTNSIHVEE